MCPVLTVRGLRSHSCAGLPRRRFAVFTSSLTNSVVPGAPFDGSEGETMIARLKRRPRPKTRARQARFALFIGR